MKKVLVVILLVSLLAGLCVGLSACNEKGSTLPETEGENVALENTTSGGDLEIIQTMQEGIVLLSGDTTSSVNGISKNLTATVYPEDATNKEVDWFLEWETATDEDISNYLILEVPQDGSRTCTVTCIKGFEGLSAKVTVITRDGGFSASCLVTYAGVPKYMLIQMDGQSDDYTDYFRVTNGSYSGSYYLKNDLGTSIDGSNAIGSKYGNYEIESVYADLKYYVTVTGVNNGTIVYEEDVLVSLSSSSPDFVIEKSHDNITNPLDLTINKDTFVDVSLDGAVLNVNIKKTQGSVLYGSSSTRTGWIVTYKGAYYPGQGGGQEYPCMIRVLAKETVSGKESYVTFVMVTSASDVTLEPSALEF